MLKTNWRLHVFFLEIRKIMAYRSDFWVNQIGNIVFTLVISYSLWKNIYDFKGVDVLNGHTLNSLVFYYLIASIVSKAMLGEDIGFLSKEIYEGTLNRFLVYPISLFQYKHITFLTHSLFQSVQVIFIFFIQYLYLEKLSLSDIPYSHYFLGVLTMTLASSLFFMIACVLESVAFWADQTWTLLVAFRMSCNFFGGSMLPLNFFPEWGQKIIAMTPFPYIINFPLKVFLGEYDSRFYFENLMMLSFWYLLFLGVFKLIWHKGKYQYTGVGM